jgi:exoribonuclease R
MSNAQSLPRIIGLICEKVLLSGSIQQLEDEALDYNAIDLIMERYIDDLNKRREYKLATKLIQSPSGDISWILEDSEAQTESGILWCKLDCKNFREAVANPLDSKEEPIKLSTSSVSGRRGTFHEGIVKVDTIRRRVLFDEETEDALSSTYFGASFPCRVDPKNPILFFPLDHRYPKFANLPMLLIHTCKGVVCFDPKSINSTPKVSDFIPLEVAAKMLFVVKFLGWRKEYPYPLGIIIAALPPGHSCYSGELALRISNNIPLGPCSVKNVSQMQAQMAEESHISGYARYQFRGAFTIDPEGSADHDDALTCRLISTADKGAEYEIGVHIIDVQSYIPKDSELDEEARKRGCSSYRSSDQCISSMLPEEMVQTKLSIAEGESRNTLSVVGRYLINKSGDIEEVPNSIMFKESTVNSALGLTYEEAQQILFKEPSHSVQNKIACYNRVHESIEDQLAYLWKIALFIRQNRLGKDAAYSFTLDEPEKQKCPEAHYLIEELMIWANSHVALKLLKTFPGQTILRVQPKPPDSELANLRKNHGPAMAISLGLKRYILSGQEPLDQIQILQSICTQIRDYLSKKLCRNALHYVKFEHLHPQIAVATVGLRQSRKACRTDYIVSDADTREYWHDTLQCAQYTHSTSPIRRYIDIVVQRLLHAAICRRACPYSKKELAEMCEQVKKAMKNSNNYDREVKRLDLASSLESVSQEYVSSIQRITEDAEIELTFADPHLKVLYARERLIALKHLNALSIPSAQGREMSPEPSNKLSSDISITESVIWQVKVAYFKGTSRGFFLNHRFAASTRNTDGNDQKRCANISLFVPEGNILSEHSNLDEHKIVLSIIPYTHSIPQAMWTELQSVCKLDLSEYQDQKRLAEILLKIFTFSQSGISDLPSVTSCSCPLLIYKLSRPIQTSEIFQVQMTTSTRNSILSPSLQLVEVGPELRICIQHNSNTAECFADKLVEDASKRQYLSIGDYFRCWEQVLLSEAASESLSESELLIVKDAALSWPKLDHECDSFGHVLYKLNVPPGKKDGGVVMKFPTDFLKMSYEFFKFDIGDLLCVRYDVEQDEKKFGFVFHMVIHHAEIERKTMERTSNIESATFYLKFVGPSSNSISPEIAKLLIQPTIGVTLKCEIQLLPLTLPFR